MSVDISPEESEFWAKMARREWSNSAAEVITALRSALTCRELEHEGCRKDLREARAEVERQKQLVEILRRGVLSVQALILESRGVEGLHLNGDVALWDDLRTGGRFETWLVDLDDALAALDLGVIDEPATTHCPDSAACRDETVRELTAEVERLRVDAERIAWVLPVLCSLCSAEVNERAWRLAEKLNAGLEGVAAIDAAMRGEG